MADLDHYLGRITSRHRPRPKFVATLSGVVQPLVDLQATLAGMPQDFDLDQAVGAQLDIVGLWMGQTRDISYPLSGLWFAFDVPGKGFDQGFWKGSYGNDIGVSVLDDDTYRRLLRAVVLANRWDGTTPAAQAILDAFFDDPDTRIFIEDRGRGVAEWPWPWFAFDIPARGFDQGIWQQPDLGAWFAFDDPARGFDTGVWYEERLAYQGSDATDASLSRVGMEMTIAIAGKTPTLLDLALLADGLIPPKPSGVQVTYLVSTIDGGSLFGFDVDNEFVGGFDHGAWGVTPDELIAA